MSEILTELELEELSLVDNPANPLAKAPLFKRHSEEEIEEMSEKELKKSVETLEGKVDHLTKQNEFLRKGLIDNGFVIKADTIEKKDPKETIEVNGEQVIKSDIPEPVLKALEEAKEKEVKDTLEKRAKEELPHWDQDAAQAILKMDWDEAILEALKAADAAFEATMRELGDKGGEEIEPEEKLEKLAKELQVEKKITYEQAYTEIVKTKEGKELVKLMKKGN